MKPSMRGLAGLLCACAALASGAAAAAAEKAADGPGKLELGGAEHRLEEFEKKVERMRGQPFKLGYVEEEALRRIAALQKKYPNDPKVKELFERARKALVASKGETKELAADATAYRLNEQKLKALFGEVAEKSWQAYRDKVLTADGALAKAFPPPSHEKVPITELQGKYVLLEDFEYPANEFTDMQQQFVFVGSGARGYYYVLLSCREWLGAYEAVKRYRRFVNRDVPDGMKWTVVGRITSVLPLVPQAGKKKTLTLRWGWVVQPEAIYVPERTFAVADPQLELGGRFAGEERMEEIKGALYSVKAVPDDATPERLTEIFVTAIKEKNYPLYLACIDPARTKTPKGRDRCMYHWELHQERFAELYCTVEVGKAAVSVVKGFDDSSTLEGIFLTEEDKAKIKRHAEPLLESAELRTVAFDERGRQYGSPKPRFFKRAEKKRWYITNYDQPF